MEVIRLANSMTGFGRSSISIDGRELTIELKSVNHRYLDIAFRMPRSLGFLEDTARGVLSKRFSRGHIDVLGTYRNQRNDAKTVVVDTALMNAYLTASRQAAGECGAIDDLTLSSLLRLPDVTCIIEADEDREALTELMVTAVNAASDELSAMRRREGDRLCCDLLARLDTILVIRAKIAERAPFVAEEYRRELNARIEAVLSDVEIDRARLATEVALFADKANIDEELVRLASHSVAAKELLTANEPTGRKLDFVVQEMNREFNTIGSKANDETIAALVIEGKAELEKIREQIQNIE